jgi:phage terminase large subunit-like protein
MPMAKWDACNALVSAEALKGRLCYAGLDLANTTDVASLVLLFPWDDGPEGYDVLPFFWVPEEAVDKRARKDKVPYDVWIKQGFIHVTEGDVIDYDVIRRDIVELGTQYEIKEIAADRWNAAQIITQLTGDGFTIFPFGQGFVSMASPTKRLMELVLSKQLAHGGNPVLRWMASNISVRKDPAGNVKPDKEKSTEKIDGIVATVMALGRASVQVNEECVYDTRGVLRI